MDLLSLALEAIPKALVYAAVILSVGVPAARALLVTRVAAALEPADRLRIESGLGHLGMASALALLAGLLLRAWAHTAVSFGVGESFVWEHLTVIAWESQWGAAWQRQVAGASTLLVLTWGTGQAPQLAWLPTGLLAVVMCYLVPLMGHAEGETPRVLLHGSHVLAAGGWVGTLMAMMLAVPRDLRAPMLTAFAPLAFAGATVLGMSGLVAAWIYLASPRNLVETTYGWMLALKIILALDVALFGFLNWRWLHRRPAAPSAGPATEAAASPQVFALLEVAMAVMVILVTAVLTETEHP